MQHRNFLDSIDNFKFSTDSLVDDRPDEVIIYELKKQYSTPKIQNKININFKNIITPDHLILAWSQIKSKPSNMITSTFTPTLQGIHLDWFEKTSAELSKGTFVYPLSKCVFISKPKDLSATNPIIMTNPRIKIIERAFFNELEKYFEGLWVWKQINSNVYETLKSNPSIPKNDLKISQKIHYIKKWIHRPIFLSSSYGFRPNRSPHTALLNVKYWRTNTTWILDYDVRKAFDNVNRNRLENIFSSYINSPQLWQEIAKMLKTNIVQPDLIYKTSGVSQSILSPFLFNIYMTELDKYIEHLKDTVPHENSDSDKFKQAKKEYSDFLKDFSTQFLGQTIKRYGSVEEMYRQLVIRKKKYYHKWDKSVKEKYTPIFSNIEYVRYADDFLIGVIGTKDTAKWVREKIDTFVKSDLHLEVKKNDIVNRNDRSVLFLGFAIYLSQFKTSLTVKWKKLRATRKYKDRILARLKTGDAKLAKAAVFNIKRLLIKIIRATLEKNTKKFSEENVQQNIQDILSNLPQNSNLALYRWEKHFSDLFHQNQTLGLTYHHKQLTSLELSENEYSPMAYLKLHQLREKYIRDIDKIQGNVIEQMIRERQQQITEKKQKHQSVDWTNLSAVDIRSAAELFVREKLNQKQVRRISINAPMNKLIQKLVDDNFLHPLRKTPMGNPQLTQFNDGEIIRKYSEVMHSLLEYYSPADNFSSVKSLVEYLRKSCILTLAMRHKKSKAWAYKTYGLDCHTIIGDKHFELPTIKNVANRKSKFKDSMTLVTNHGLDISSMTNKYSLRLSTYRKLLLKKR